MGFILYIYLYKYIYNIKLLTTLFLSLHHPAENGTVIVISNQFGQMPAAPVALSPYAPIAPIAL